MKKVSKVVLTAVVALSLSNLFAPKANAFGLINLAVDGRLDYVGTPTTMQDFVLTAMCIALLPFCILDGQSAAGHVTVADLRNNGYSEAEINSIMAGQNAVVSYLQTNKLAVQKSGSMNSVELAAFISQVPGVTPAYVNFVVNN